MLRFYEACNGCSFYFPASFITNLPVKTAFASHKLKLSLPILRKYLNFCLISVSCFYRHVSDEKRVFRATEHIKKSLSSMNI